MRITVMLDDDLLAYARQFTGLTGTSAVVTKALEALIEREAAKRLALLGGSQPGLKPIPRRRPRKRSRS